GGREQGKRIVKLQAGKINGQQQELSSRAEIVSRDQLIRLSDDVSKLKMMLFSNNYGEFKHQRYIVGYPDGEFKPEKKITRAEIVSWDEVIRLIDDVSKLKMMRFSNYYGEFKHQRYIVGCPDVEF